MVRTKADNCAKKVVGAKVPQKNVSEQSSTGNGSTSGKTKKPVLAGMNPVCPRPTPEWQKTIDNFLIKEPREPQE